MPIGWTGELLILGEAPGADEDDDSGRPFSGPSGELLRILWREAGYNDIDVALHNANRCRPKRNNTPTMQQVRACRPFMLRVLEQLRPKLVLGVGGTALRSLLNVGNRTLASARGQRLQIPGGIPGISCVRVSYHPAAILRGATHLRSELLNDLRRMRTDDLTYPEVGFPTGRMVAIDTEFDPNGRLLTIAVADSKKAIAFDL